MSGLSYLDYNIHADHVAIPKYQQNLCHSLLFVTNQNMHEVLYYKHLLDDI